MRKKVIVKLVGCLVVAGILMSVVSARGYAQYSGGCDDAPVYLDDNYKGKTGSDDKYLISGISEGSHIIKGTESGYDDRSTNVSMPSTEAVNFPLTNTLSTDDEAWWPTWYSEPERFYETDSEVGYKQKFKWSTEDLDNLKDMANSAILSCFQWDLKRFVPGEGEFDDRRDTAPADVWDYWRCPSCTGEYYTNIPDDHTDFWSEEMDPPWCCMLRLHPEDEEFEVTLYNIDALESDKEYYISVVFRKRDEMPFDKIDIETKFEFIKYLYPWEIYWYTKQNASELSNVLSSESCPLKGDKPPCDGIVSDFELLDYINLWAKGKVGDFDLLEAIDNWAHG